MTVDNGRDMNLAGAAWRSSTYSQANGACVEVADGMGAVVPVRDSKDRDRRPLTFSSASWSAFITNLKADGS
ncbi:DUF397 domain-containing protein [Streptomyces benahoarensis]|uniref:DUF397 domain-containing protein n=1 Tax=Streptomyces benahoarensis TaxID=2595054 RepID=A0A553ZA22_9ACTN|nr:DUF397 domain-containing protein [Streptomyces benahoarensis]TSB19970.1 DUF397 domain-containing protein [Streptomyces benahoarensis]TSB38281.1 DUF397 domain-containing protein [Streptomyces benahoarensis]